MSRVVVLYIVVVLIVIGILLLYHRNRANSKKKNASPPSSNQSSPSSNQSSPSSNQSPPPSNQSPPPSNQSSPPSNQSSPSSNQSPPSSNQSSPSSNQSSPSSEESLPNLFPGELVGFGVGTKGGEGGPEFRVTSLADSGTGTLRQALQTEGPLIVKFDVSGDINLITPIICKSFKTIDGRGKKVFIKDYGIRMKEAQHCIFRNLHFRRNRGDAIEIRESSYAWIHECTFGDTTTLSANPVEPDGIIDVVQKNSHHVTISRCYAYQHNKAFLFSYGATDITVHHNYFYNLAQRTPLVRGNEELKDKPGDAYVHVFNNFIESSGPIIGKGGSHVLVENNVFKNGRTWATCDPPRDICPWGTRTMKAVGSKLIGNNMVHGSEKNPNWVLQPPYEYTLDSVDKIATDIPKLRNTLLN